MLTRLSILSKPEIAFAFILIKVVLIDLTVDTSTLTEMDKSTWPELVCHMATC